MGTSQSSRGAPGGVPMVPPWVPDVVAPVDPEGPVDQSGAEPGDQDGVQPVPPVPVGVAPSGRFQGARTSLGSFASSGSKRDMYRGVKHYVQAGYGGSGGAVSRMARTARTAGSLYGALSAFAANQVPPGSALDRKLLTTYDAQGVINAVVEVVAPGDGTLDGEACREAIADALSELLDRFPDADLLNLSADQRAFAIECYVAQDVFKHIELDIGNTIRDKAPTVKDAMLRFSEIWSYIQETVSAAFRHLREQRVVITSQNIAAVASAALKETFEVFEAYTQ